MKPLRDKPEKECKVCQKKFTQRRVTQVFCSRSCQNREYYRTLRAFAEPGLESARKELAEQKHADQLKSIAALVKSLTEPSIYVHKKLPTAL